MEGFNWSILGWIAGLIFVYIFGLFEGRSQGRKRRMAEEEQERREKPAPPPATIKVDDPGLLRIKNEQGMMTLDLDGQRVQPTALTAEQRKRLIQMLNAMRPWLEGKPASIPVSTAPPPPKPSPIPVHDKPVPAPVASPSPQPESSTSVPQPKPSTSNKKKEEEEPAPTSIVGQINLILQQRINNTPLEARGVLLMESSSGGVNVYVGTKRYEAIDDVPDDEVKAAIRAAIAEWEKKYTPGQSN